jgi:hypothetical protein
MATAGGLVDLFWNPAYFWRPIGTHCLNLATSKFFWSKYGDFLKKFKNSFVEFASPFLCRQVAKIR